MRSTLPPRRGPRRLECLDREPLVRIEFADRAALLDGFARAQDESWIVDCHADMESRTLELRLAANPSDLLRGDNRRACMERIAGDRS